MAEAFLLQAETWAMADGGEPEQAMETTGAPEADAAGALEGGEAHRGDPAAAPRPLGRKDPAVTGEASPDKDNVPIRG